MEKRSDELHRSIENSHLHTESAQTQRKDQVDFTEALKAVTYILQMHGHGELIRWSSWKHWKQSLTCWGYTDMEKRWGGLHGSIENSHIHTEDAQTKGKDQVDFTEALKTITYMLKVHRQGEKIRWTSQKHWKQSLTRWGWTNMEKRWGGLHRSTENGHLHPEGAQTRRQRSGGLHGSTENSHLHAEDAQTRRKDQVDFTEALKTVTYMLRVHRHREKIRWTSQALKTVTYTLRMHRHQEKIRWTSQKHWKQSLTYWGCTDKETRSDGPHRSIENSHLHTENAQTRRKDQVDFTEALKTVTYILRVHKQGHQIRWTSQKHWKQSFTSWGCADRETRSGGPHKSIENSHLHPKGAQTMTQRSGGLHGSTENGHLHPKGAQTRRKGQVTSQEH